MERDRTEKRLRICNVISTHTLTWSVTIERFDKQVENYISTHTLTWSVTQKIVKENHYQKISTHTLTWSVTFTILYFLKWKKHFNSHAHVERDGILML